MYVRVRMICIFLFIYPTLSNYLSVELSSDLFTWMVNGYILILPETECL